MSWGTSISTRLACTHQPSRPIRLSCNSPAIQTGYTSPAPCRQPFIIMPSPSLHIPPPIARLLNLSSCSDLRPADAKSDFVILAVNQYFYPANSRPYHSQVLSSNSGNAIPPCLPTHLLILPKDVVVEAWLPTTRQISNVLSAVNRQEQRHIRYRCSPPGNNFRISELVLDSGTFCMLSPRTWAQVWRSVVAVRGHDVGAKVF